MKTVTGMVGHTFSPSTLAVQGQLGLLHRRKKKTNFWKGFSLCESHPVPISRLTFLSVTNTGAGERRKGYLGFSPSLTGFFALSLGARQDTRMVGTSQRGYLPQAGQKEAKKENARGETKDKFVCLGRRPTHFLGPTRFPFLPKCCPTMNPSSLLEAYFIFLLRISGYTRDNLKNLSIVRCR